MEDRRHFKLGGWIIIKNIDKSFKGFAVSDLHMGVGDKADDFIQNSSLFKAVSQDYNDKGYTLIMLGDIYDLWETPDILRIKQAHPAVQQMIDKFEQAGRLIKIKGNHDNSLAWPESVILQSVDESIILVHGHQGDFFNSQASWLGRFFVRYIWRNLEMVGFKDPTTAVKDKNLRKHEMVRRTFREWSLENKQRVIFGHTHFAESDAYCWNCGSWTGEGGSGVEINGDQIEVKHFI